MPKYDQTHDRIYDLATSLVHEHGVYFSYRQLERLAGVGSGGIRNHYATKEDLIAEYARDEIQRYIRALRAKAAESDAGAALQSWIDHLIDWLPQTFGRAGLMLSAIRHQDSPLHILTLGLISATEPLVAAASVQGWIRVGVTGEELVVAIFAAATAADALIGGPAPQTETQRIAMAKKLCQAFLEGLSVAV